ncbi:protocadherin alpha-7-like isoform X9 [Acipenser ruthenus]|uniref:protocadherin alpha-7-like isoform X9 n=1 Tax=Acipenser ruthenus TaxID=7906 RepID=UPI002740CC42|nr:protocadherin alpha-7-like isoform X9 [Acipenser ruthenus]
MCKRSLGFGSSFVCFIALSWVWNRASAQLRYSIPEELDHGSFVGNIAQDLGIDIKELENRRLRIVSGSKQQHLQVNQKNGVLFVDQNIDREQLCDRNPDCSISLKIVVENPLEIHYVEVGIVDVNDHSPVFSVNQTHLEIAESAQQGSRFPLESAHDPDIGTNSLRSYQLNQNEHFDLVLQDRSEYSIIPILVLQKPLDRERNKVHHLILTALDGGIPQRSGILNIYVIVLDINDNAPVFDNQMYSVYLKENSPKGTVVIKLNASDLDDGLNGEIVYAFGKSNTDTVIDVFQLEYTTGEITVKGSIDFEEKQVYEIDIQATDRGPFPIAVHCSVIVHIVDVNDNAPEIEVTSLTNTVSEDTLLGTAIALISVSDLDSGINSKIVCKLSENAPFGLKPSYKDNLYSLITNARLDREVTSQYNITVTAQDLGKPPLSSFKTFSVTISDVNDNKPQFPQNPYTFYVLENNVPGASIFYLKAFDLDQNENARISYLILDTLIENRPVSSFVSINCENGNVYATNSFDFEKLKQFQFYVLASDSGVPSLSSNVTVNVFVLDQNDNAPVILSPLPNDGSSVSCGTVPRNVNAGYLVTKIRAYDADLGYNAWLSFSLQDATDPTLFGVRLYTGEIRTLRRLTENDDVLQKLTILVKDSGNISLSTTMTLHITIVEDTEGDIFSELKGTSSKSEEHDITFYLIITLGSVSSLFVISIITLVALQCCKARGNFVSKYPYNPNYAEVSGNGSLYRSYQYRMCSNAVQKDLMFVKPEANAGASMDIGSNGNTLIISDIGMKPSREPRQPNTDWRYSASLRAGMQSSVLMEESAVLQGAPVVHVQNWPTVSSATPEPDAGEVSPPVGAGINSNSWTFKYGPGNHHQQQQQQQQLLKPGEVPENFIIPGSPAIISIRQDQAGAVDGKGDFITFGKKEETKKKKKKKKGKADKKEKGGGNNDNSDH